MAIDLTIPRFGVAGDPVAHSRSPQMHLAAYAALGIEADYQRLPIPPELFAETVRALPGSGFRGINVTIPHKQAALALADSASDAARAIGAANTLTFSDSKIHADNTDAPGMISAIPFDVEGKRALVLGAGGTARAASWALKDSGAEVLVVNRTVSRAEELARSLGVAAAAAVPEGEKFDLVVHATSVGMQDDDTIEGLIKLGFSIENVAPGGVVIEFVYRADGTPLTRAAADRGLTVIDGHELLARQGALSFQIWFNVDPPIDAMRAALA
jgi:shikimate dehydrogenase